jgi:hypothetical protein
MTGSTISGAITYGITLNSFGFNSPLTISASGNVTAQAGVAGVYASGTTGAILNSGVINGGAAPNAGPSAGAGVLVSGGVKVFNAGAITGGAGNDGAAGVVTNLYIANVATGTITGGASGESGSTAGVGVLLEHATLMNAGLITGGADQIEIGYQRAGAGVDGSGYVSNRGTIIGGAGALDNYKLAAGDGILMSGTVVNAGVITGGGAVTGVLDSAGGAGVRLLGGMLNNTGTITGGNDAYGGAGAYVERPGTVVNSGTIAGGDKASGLVFTDGGVVINSGLIERGAVSAYASPVAVRFENHAGTLVVEPGARFIGKVEAVGGSTLELSGFGANVTGVGTQFNGFDNIIFNAGAQATVEGNVYGLASGQRIFGFSTDDEIILSPHPATGAALTGTGIELISSAGNVSLDLVRSGTANFVVINSSSGSSIIAPPANVTLHANYIELAGRGGTALDSIIDTGGSATIYAGGTVTAPTISGGVLSIAGGAVISGTIDFAGAGGTLELGGTVAPANVISGFAAGDTIQLTSLPYKAGATASVSSPGHVVIHDGAATVNLNIAGTTLGESLVFGPGSVLTVGTAQMGFLAPETVMARENWLGGSVAVEAPAVPPLFVSSSVHFSSVPDLVVMVHKGGVQSFMMPREH